MRPEKLFALFYDATRLKGVGPGAKKALGRLFFGQDSARVIVRDLVFHLPVSLIDRRHSPSLAHAQSGDIVTYRVTVETHHAPPLKRGSKIPYKIVCHMSEGFLTLIFFHARGDYLKQLLPPQSQRVISGRFERFDGIAQITHPDIIAPLEEYEQVCTIEPVYGLTGGLSNRQLRKTILAALELLPDLPEWINEALLKQHQWPHWRDALHSVHHPQSLSDIGPLSLAHCRLAYDELLAHQLALAITRKRVRKRSIAAMPSSGILRSQVLASLPFALTSGQEKVLAEIDADLSAGERMLRLLQGDVGSGKTIIALLAMLRVVEAGKQAALMVPTELLAQQHYATISRIAMPLGLKVVLLVGGQKNDPSLQSIAAGDADIVIGTHALFQERVLYKSLALAVIDEQHRFGVAQRMALADKSPDTHILVMTATPIPRTLAMAAFGDMDSSELTEKPAGRLEIATKTIPLSRVDEVIEGLERATTKGEKIYWICPLIEESEEDRGLDLAAAQARFIEFTHRFKKRAALMHGRMTSAERDSAMRGFAGEEYDILVATTVVEVGVDVPDATIIVIEHAERFGLAQLHQLRGRVGRSDKPSTCLLLYADRCGEIARSRLRIMRETNDGFRIAEEDMRLRGGGDILGTRQSGLPSFHFADIAQHSTLLRTAHNDARYILATDPTLTTARGQALRYLLYLFEYDENIRYLAAG